MCGINGSVGFSKENLPRMNTLLKHRGPDFAGSFYDENVSLGHTLLSIRDSANVSRQPYTKPGSPWILLFNGQLYNTRQLKHELGVTFANTDLDTALLFGMIEKHGWNFIEKIHGMFAVALYNVREQEIRLYRDPSGQKILYYYFKDGKFAWSSELKPLLALPDISKEIDALAISVASAIGYIPGDKTLFAHIKKLNVGECVRFHISKKNLNASHFQSDTENYYTGTPADVIADLVTEHLQSKQRVALNLSGGLDSSLLLHEMSRVGHEMHTYTNIFEGGSEKYNEDALLARRLAKDYGSDHREIVITKKDFLENFIEAYRTIEEPNFNITLPAYLLTAKIEGAFGDNNRVVLSGDGGDEIFGGYPHYGESRRMGQKMRLLSSPLYNLLKNARNHTDYRFDNPVHRWYFFRRFSELFTKENSEDILFYLEQAAKYLLETAPKQGSVYETMLCDRALWMAGENFIRSDKLYMSQSLEMRSPLSYHPFRAHMDRVLAEKDYVAEHSNKVFLRNLYRGKLPDYITSRIRKSGWRSPIELWYDDTLKKRFLEILPSHQSELINWSLVRRTVEKKATWPGKHIHLYLSLAILEKEFSVTI